MKKTLLIALFAVAAVGANAQHDHGQHTQAAPKKQAAKVTELKCAVMPEHKVQVADAIKRKLYSDYKGKRYVFCCSSCKPKFDKDPAKYAKANSIPVPAPVKK